MGHARARESNTGDDCGNLETQLDDLTEFGLRDEFSYEYVVSGRAHARYPSTLPCCV